MEMAKKIVQWGMVIVLGMGIAAFAGCSTGGAAFSSGGGASAELAGSSAASSEASESASDAATPAQESVIGKGYEFSSADLGDGGEVITAQNEIDHGRNPQEFFYVQFNSPEDVRILFMGQMCIGTVAQEGDRLTIGITNASQDSTIPFLKSGLVGTVEGQTLTLSPSNLPKAKFTLTEAPFSSQ